MYEVIRAHFLIRRKGWELAKIPVSVLYLWNRWTDDSGGFRAGPHFKKHVDTLLEQGHGCACPTVVRYVAACHCGCSEICHASVNSVAGLVNSA